MELAFLSARVLEHAGQVLRLGVLDLEGLDDRRVNRRPLVHLLDEVLGEGDVLGRAGQQDGPGRSRGHGYDLPALQPRQVRLSPSPPPARGRLPGQGGVDCVGDLVRIRLVDGD